MRLPILILLLSGCTTMPGSVSRDEAALSAELQGRTAGAPEACVSASGGGGLVIASADTLVYREGRTIWVNRLGGRCLGMRPDRQVLIEPSSGNRYCRGDRVRAIDLTTSYSGAICPLGDFIPYRAR